MEDLYLKLVNEICNEGLEGYPLSTIFDLLAQRVSKTCPEIKCDDFIQQKMFSILKKDPTILFYKRLSDKVSKNPVTSQGSLIYNDRIELDISERETLQDSKDIYLVASFEIRSKFLGITESNRKMVSDVQYCCCEMIAKGRCYGGLQNEIGRILNIDPRNATYHLKTLEDRGLILERVPVTKNKVQSNITFHFRFTPDYSQVNVNHQVELEYRQEMEPKLLELFEKHNTSILIETEVKRTFGITKKTKTKWEKLKASLIKDGILEITSIQDEKTQKVEVCFKLLNSSAPNRSNTLQETSQEEEEALVVGFVIETPIAHQFYDFIYENTDPIPSSTVIHHFGVNYKMGTNLINSLQDFGLEKTVESNQNLICIPDKEDDEDDEKEDKMDQEEEGDDLIEEDLEDKMDQEEQEGDSETKSNKRYSRKEKKISSATKAKIKSISDMITSQGIIGFKDLRSVQLTEVKQRRRIMKTMEEDGILVCKTIHYDFDGKSVELKCWLRPGLSTDDQIVLDFINKNKKKKQGAKKKTLVAQESLPELKSIKTPKVPIPKPDRSEYVALRYGYLNAKMLRVQEFYKHLYEMYVKNEALKLENVLSEMTVERFAKVIGIYHLVEGIDTYWQTKIKDLTQEASEAILGKHGRVFVFPRFRDIYRLLGKLGLVESIKGQPYFAQVKINTSFNLTEANKQWKWTNDDELKTFWSEFAGWCLNIKHVETYLMHNEGQDKTPQADFEIFRTCAELKVRQNWTEIRSLTNNNLYKLKEYRSTNPTPSSDECQEIAKKLSPMGLETVVLYFYRHADKYTHKRKLESTLAANKKTKTDKEEEKEEDTRHLWTPEDDIKLLDVIIPMDWTQKLDWDKISLQIGIGNGRKCEARWNRIRHSPQYRQILEFVNYQKQTEPNAPLKSIHEIIKESKLITDDSIPLPLNIDLTVTQPEVSNTPLETILMSLLRIILLTSDSVYNKEVVKGLLSKYRPQDVNECIMRLKKIGFMVKKRSATENDRLRNLKIAHSFVHDSEWVKELLGESNDFYNVMDREEIKDWKGGYVSNALCMAINGNIVLQPEFKAKTESKSSKSKKGGVKAHLVNQGAAQEGIDFVSGKVSKEAIALPEWKISLTQVDTIDFDELDNEIPDETIVPVTQVCESFRELNPCLSAYPQDVKELTEAYARIHEKQFDKEIHAYKREILDKLANFDLIQVWPDAILIKDKEYVGHKYKLVETVTGPLPLSDTTSIPKKVEWQDEATTFHSILELNGELNQNYVNGTRRALVDMIFKNPGVTLEMIKEKFGNHDFNVIQDLLNIMEMDGIIIKKCTLYTIPSLFDDGKEGKVISFYCDVNAFNKL